MTAIIAIDFDGTCVTHDYPSVGKDIGAVPVLKNLIEQDCLLILWTMRSGERLKEAEAWFADNDIELFGVQENPGQYEWTTSPKAFAHIYIDDAALGCPLIIDDSKSLRPFVDWKEVSVLLAQSLR